MKHQLGGSVLASLTFAAAASLVAQAQEPPTFQQIVQPYVDQGRFAGANGVVVTTDGIINFPSAGYADVATKVPMTRDTVFWLASTSKPFQATALMMLVDDGKIGLDDPVTKYLPHFKPRSATRPDGKKALREPAHPITVRMLLNHTHGLSPNYSPAAPPDDGVPLKVWVDELLTRPLLHEPGVAFTYSDAGSNVSSRIVEVVSGKAFEEFLDERLLTPLGMKDTTYFPNSDQLSRLATAYYVPPGTKQLTPVPDELARPRPRAQLSDRQTRHAPMGGLFSTGGDVARFAQLFLGKGSVSGRRYLSESAVTEMTRDQIPDAARATIPQPPSGNDRPVSYGLGWGLGARGSYFHPGMAMTNIRIDDTRSFATIFLPQHGGDEVVLEIQTRLLDAAERHWHLHH
jgi:CubicO group peptidase (beta-lactamase class C family)